MNFIFGERLDPEEEDSITIEIRSYQKFGSSSPKPKEFFVNYGKSESKVMRYDRLILNIRNLYPPSENILFVVKGHRGSQVKEEVQG